MRQPIGFCLRIQEATVRLSAQMPEPLASGFALARRRWPAQQQALLLPGTRAPRHCLPPSWTLRWPTDSSAAVDSTERGCRPLQQRRARTGPCSSSGRSSSGLSCCRCSHWRGRCLSVGFRRVDSIITLWLLELETPREEERRLVVATRAAVRWNCLHLCGQTCCTQCGRMCSENNWTAGAQSCSRSPWTDEDAPAMTLSCSILASPVPWIALKVSL